MGVAPISTTSIIRTITSSSAHYSAVMATDDVQSRDASVENVKTIRSEPAASWSTIEIGRSGGVDKAAAL